MPIVRPSDLPKDTTPPATDYVVIDGVGLRATTIEQLVTAGRPTASTLEAQTATDDFKAMTPLKTKQAIDFLVAAGYVPTTRAITAGTGLTGGGTLASNRELALNSASIASLLRADTSVQPFRSITAGTGLTGGGNLSADRSIALNAASIASLAKADSATQPGDLAPVATLGTYASLTGKPTLGALAAKDTVGVPDINATGTPGPTSALFGDNTWKVIPGGGDMLKSVYDPQSKETDAFARANHTGTQAPSTITFPAWVQSMIGLTMQADQLLYGTGANTMALTAFTSFARTLVALTNGGAVYGALGEIPDGQLPPRLQTSGSAVTNLNTIVMNGEYRHAAGATGQPVNAAGLVTHIQYDSTNSAIQYWINAGLTEPNTFTYVRHKSSGVWGGWFRTYTKASEINALINAIADDYLPLTGGTLTGGLNVNGNVSITGSTYQFLANGNKHLWFKNAGGAEDALIYFDSTTSVLRMRIAGSGAVVYINSSGDVVASGRAYAGGGSSFLEPNGNVQGSVWSGFGTGHNDAFNAINGRIEARGTAYYNAAVAQIIPTIAAQTVGSVGTYAFLCVIPNVALAPGSGASGADLYYTGASPSSIKTSPTGLWRAMGRTNASSNDNERTTLFLRYA